MNFDSKKLLGLVEVAGGPVKVCLAYETVHGKPLARTTLFDWTSGQKEPGINKLLAILEVFGVGIDEVLSEGPSTSTDEWYVIVSRSESNGPRPQKGPYQSIKAARQAILTFQTRHGLKAATTHMRRARSTIVGPFSSVSQARNAKKTSGPLVEECWT